MTLRINSNCHFLFFLNNFVSVENKSNQINNNTYTRNTIHALTGKIKGRGGGGGRTNKNN